MKTLNIGIAGLGTVGAETFRILAQDAEMLTKRCGNVINVVAVSARNKDKDRGIDISKVTWYDNPVDMAQDDDIDVIVELMGGSEGDAYDLCESALKNGKAIVTANKALIAHHGSYFATLADKANVALAFEAAVAGGIPIIKTLKEGLAANHFSHVSGILNGTCNYILTEMTNTGQAFSDILKDAQKLGYAEADPTFDIEGIDAAHKITILSSLAFGTEIKFDQTSTEGISNITNNNILHAAELGYAIKLLGICKKIDGKVLQAVYPCLVAKELPIANVHGVNNAVAISGSAVGNVILEGPGAGAGATASAVVADIIDIAAKRFSYPLNIPVAALESVSYLSLNDRIGEYYLSIKVTDTPGVLAEITDILNSSNISTKSLLQKPVENEKIVEIIFITHNVVEHQIKQAMEQINHLDAVTRPTQWLRVES